MTDYTTLILIGIGVVSVFIVMCVIGFTEYQNMYWDSFMEEKKNRIIEVRKRSYFTEGM